MSKKYRRRIRVNGEVKWYSHYIWHQNTGHWPIIPDEVVHHIDEDPSNDSFSNLRLMTNFEHRSLHNSGENHPRYGKTHTEESIAKMRASKLGVNNPNYGKHFSEEHKAKIGAANSGEKASNWLGDDASDQTKYARVWRARRRAARV